MLHAADHPLSEIELSEDRWLVLGPDRAANILELIVVVTEDRTEAIIHAMQATKENLRHL